MALDVQESQKFLPREILEEGDKTLAWDLQNLQGPGGWGAPVSILAVGNVEVIMAKGRSV